MKRLLLALALFSLLSSTPGCSNAALPAVPVDTADLVLPDDVGPILVLVDHLPGKASFARERAEQVAIALRHFSTQTSWAYVDAAPLEQVASAAAVVYLGLDGSGPPSPAALARLRQAHRLVLSRYHLSALREAGIAFRHTHGGEDVAALPGTVVQFKGQAFPVALPDFLAFSTRAPARTVSSYRLAAPDAAEGPYIIQDGDALFVNGDISFDSNEATRRGAMLAVCDAMIQFLGARPLPPRPLAMLRLEDVSAATPAGRLEDIVRYLAAAHVPYGIAVIPDIRTEGKAVPPLRDNPELLDTLHWAENHGATVILHGLHHCCSSEDAEGYEFWDHGHNAPVPHDSAGWMRSQIAEGIADEAALGLRPRLWETPHYSASPLDYKVVSEFFGAAWELRRPVGWLPWALRRDQYGTMLLPEDLGYVSLDGTKTVADQLARARELLACQGCLAAGFLHPSTVRMEDVRDYVAGLRDLGYAFVDPARALQQYANAPGMALVR
jgi:Uncharacterized protein conserved in bacteria (DUF2334)